MGQEVLEIKVGADLDAAVKAFEKLRKDIDKSMKGGADSFKKFVQTYQAEIPKVTRGTADATNALTNFSRIAGDAAYGIQGIGNNISPAIESFQRLQKETGSAEGAFKALAGSLMGAGGIIFGINLATTLLIAFGDKLFSAREKAKYLSDDLIRLGQQADNLKQSIQDLGDEISFLNKISSITIQLKGGQNSDVMRREMERFKFNAQDLEENVLPGLNRQLSELAIRAARAPVGSDEAKQVEEATKKTQEAFNEAIKQRSEFSKQALLLEQNLQLSLKKEREKAEKGPKPQFNFFDQFFDVTPNKNRIEKQIVDMAKVAREFANRNRNIFVGLDEILLSTSNEKTVEAGKRFWAAFQRGVVQLKAPPVSAQDLGLIPEVKPEDAKRFLDNFTKTLEGIRDRQNGVMGGADIADGERRFKEFLAQGGQVAVPMMETLWSRARNLADTISGVVTPAFQGMFDALFEGKNAVQGFFQGVANGLKSLLSRMAAALVQALALKAVFSVLFPGSTIAKAGIGKLFGGMLGFAQGGVVFGPTAALIGEGLGTSRSNPEIVAPLDKLKNLIGGAGLGGNVNLNGEFVIRGKDLVYVLAQTQSSHNRRF